MVPKVIPVNSLNARVRRFGKTDPVVDWRSDVKKLYERLINDNDWKRDRVSKVQYRQRAAKTNQALQ